MIEVEYSDDKSYSDRFQKNIVSITREINIDISSRLI